MSKDTAQVRATRSGFPAKLNAYLDSNARDQRAGRNVRGPTSKADLARRLTNRGESALPNTVERWTHGLALPGARHISLLEVWLGASWSYLDDATKPWPVERDVAHWRRLALSMSDRERDLLMAALLDKPLLEAGMDALERP